MVHGHDTAQVCADLIKEIAAAIGLKEVAPDKKTTRLDEPDMRASMSVLSHTVICDGNGMRGQTLTTKHTIQVLDGAPHADGTPGQDAGVFVRFIGKVIQTAGGLEPFEDVNGKKVTIQKLVLEQGKGDRSLEFHHSYAPGAISETEKGLQKVRDKLLAATPEAQELLESFKKAMAAATALESKYTSPSKPIVSATRVTPILEFDGNGKPILGLEIQTNHPDLIEGFEQHSNGTDIKISNLSTFSVVVKSVKEIVTLDNGASIRATGAKGLEACSSLGGDGKKKQGSLWQKLFDSGDFKPGQTIVGR